MSKKLLSDRFIPGPNGLTPELYWTGEGRHISWIQQ
jgi:hypothetical protein